MQRIIASASSSGGGDASARFAGLDRLPLRARLAGGESAASTFFVCWPLVARPDRRTSSRTIKY